MKNSTILVLLLVCFSFVNAQENQETEKCPHAKKIRSLCMYIGSQAKDNEMNSERYVWGYQRRIFEAACVDIHKDNEEEIARKVSEVWNANEHLLECSSPQFDISKGNILKYAVGMKFEAFLIDAAYWGVNLNKIDAADNATVMDYIAMQLERNKGLPTEPLLKRYYDMFKRFGAKHRVELVNE